MIAGKDGVIETVHLCAVLKRERTRQTAQHGRGFINGYIHALLCKEVSQADAHDTAADNANALFRCHSFVNPLEKFIFLNAKKITSRQPVGYIYAPLIAQVAEKALIFRKIYIAAYQLQQERLVVRKAMKFFKLDAKSQLLCIYRWFLTVLAPDQPKTNSQRHYPKQN